MYEHRTFQHIVEVQKGLFLSELIIHVFLGPPSARTRLSLPVKERKGQSKADHAPLSLGVACTS